MALKEQLDFLVEVFLENRRGLHLLTAEKAGLSLERRMLSLCKAIRNSQRHGPTAKGMNYEKQRKTSKFLG